MNAVEAMEQLAAMGRRLRVKELSLQQPAAVLHVATDCERVLVDPLASLSALLAESGRLPAQSAPQATETTTARAPATFTWEDGRPAASEGTEWRGDRAAGIGAGGQAGEELPAEGMRLARRQASLLGILNANLEASTTVGERRPARVPPSHDSMQARQEGVAQEDGRRLNEHARALWDGVPATHDDVANAGQQLPADVPKIGRPATHVEHVGSERNKGALDPREGAQAIQVDVPYAGQTGAQMDAQADGQVGGRAGAGMIDATAGHDAMARRWQEGMPDAHARVQAARDGMRMERRTTRWGADAESTVGGLAQSVRNGTAGDLDAVPAMPADLWQAAAGTSAERPLSMAQIEQVLIALDERLELMLLRMYGTSGGAV